MKDHFINTFYRKNKSEPMPREIKYKFRIVILSVNKAYGAEETQKAELV